MREILDRIVGGLRGSIKDEDRGETEWKRSDDGGDGWVGCAILRRQQSKGGRGVDATRNEPTEVDLEETTDGILDDAEER